MQEPFQTKTATSVVACVCLLFRTGHRSEIGVFQNVCFHEQGNAGGSSRIDSSSTDSSSADSSGSADSCVKRGAGTKCFLGVGL